MFASEDSQNYIIRGYTKCTAYDDSLEAWFNSTAFEDWRARSKPLRDKISNLDTGIDTSLEEWWNVYDTFTVWRDYGAGDRMPAIDDATYSQARVACTLCHRTYAQPESAICLHISNAY